MNDMNCKCKNENLILYSICETVNWIVLIIFRIEMLSINLKSHCDVKGDENSTSINKFYKIGDTATFTNKNSKVRK